MSADRAPGCVDALGYVCLEATDIPAWQAFGTGFLGMQQVAVGDGGLGLRMDHKAWRLAISPGRHDALAAIGLETAGAAELEAVAARLERGGVAVRAASAEEKAARAVEDMLWCSDPDANRVELYHGGRSAGTRFTPARPIGGFRTGALGMGHVVLTSAQVHAMQAFYEGLLGLRLTDYVESPFRGVFLRANARHHSLAVLGGTEPALHHLMVEYLFMDDVGRIYDMALREPERVAVTLGRHANDHMLSFYARSPGGFMVEVGWAGRLIDEACWRPHEIYGPSIWGHERNWLPPEGRARARALVDAAAARGVLEPVHVVTGPAFDLSSLDAEFDPDPQQPG